jgi:hypothetical protein
MPFLRIWSTLGILGWIGIGGCLGKEEVLNSPGPGKPVLVVGQRI